MPRMSEASLNAMFNSYGGRDPRGQRFKGEGRREGREGRRSRNVRRGRRTSRSRKGEWSGEWGVEPNLG